MSSVAERGRTNRRRQVRAADVSHHAALRWLQRVDAAEARPAERVAEAVARAVPTRTDPDHGDAVRDPETGAVLLVDPDGGVRTVLLPDRTAAGAGRCGR